MWHVLKSYLYLMFILQGIHAGNIAPDTANILHESQYKVRRPDAVTLCRNLQSELLNYSHIMESSKVQPYTNILNDGDSAWVSGFVTFSPPIVYRGCYKSKNFATLKILNFEEFDSISLYSCVSYCLNDIKFRHFKTEFIGISHNTCKCLKQMDVNRIRPVGDSRCNTKCSNMDIDTCGGENVISVYRLYENDVLAWAKNEPPYRQCIYIKLKDSERRIKAFTSSCFTLNKSVKISGYFCQTVAHSLFDRECSLRAGSDYLCLIKDESTRQFAKFGCLAHGGILADLNREQRIMELMEEKSYYWLGVHRAYTVTDARTVFSTACLAVTKQKGNLYLDPDDCSEKKFFLCDYMASKVIPNIQSMENTPASMATMDRWISSEPLPEVDEKGSSSNFGLIIGTVISLVFIMSSSIACIIRMKCTRRQSQRQISREVVEETINMSAVDYQTTDQTNSPDIQNRMLTPSNHVNGFLNSEAQVLSQPSSWEEPYHYYISVYDPYPAFSNPESSQPSQHSSLQERPDYYMYITPCSQKQLTIQFQHDPETSEAKQYTVLRESYLIPYSQLKLATRSNYYITPCNQMQLTTPFQHDPETSEAKECTCTSLRESYLIPYSHLQLATRSEPMNNENCNENARADDINSEEYEHGCCALPENRPKPCFREESQEKAVIQQNLRDQIQETFRIQENLRGQSQNAAAIQKNLRDQSQEPATIQHNSTDQSQEVNAMDCSHEAFAMQQNSRDQSQEAAAIQHNEDQNQETDAMDCSHSAFAIQQNSEDQSQEADAVDRNHEASTIQQNSRDQGNKTTTIHQNSEDQSQEAGAIDRSHGAFAIQQNSRDQSQEATAIQQKVRGQSHEAECKR